MTAPWCDEHAALILGCATGVPVGGRGWRDVCLAATGDRRGGALLETWLALVPMWYATKESQGRDRLEIEWSRATRFIPCPRIEIVPRGDTTWAVRQRAHTAALVRGLDGAHVWIHGLGPGEPPALVLQDRPTSFRRTIQEVPPLLAAALAVVAPVRRKRPREESNVRCRVIGPFDVDQLSIVMQLCDAPQLVPLHDTLRVYPLKNRLCCVVFALVATADRRLRRGLRSALVPSERVEKQGECSEVTLMLDHFDFAAASLCKSYPDADRATRAALRPRPGTNRFVPLELLCREVGRDVPFSWEGLPHSNVGRYTAGIERVDGLELSTRHKADQGLADQLIDCVLLLGSSQRFQAEQILQHALIDGWFVKILQ